MSFDLADPVGSVFAEIIGKPCWLVQRGHAGFLTLEFGEPHLDVREPMPSSRLLKRRGISVRGDWHLWIYACNWRVLDAGQPIGRSEGSNDEIDSCARLLNGQKLLRVTVAPTTGASRFDFEGELVLATSRMDQDDLSCENWMLATPTGDWFSYRADGRYSWHAGDTTPDQAVWLDIPERR